MKYWKQVAQNAWAATVETLHLNSWMGFMGWLAGTLAVLGGLIFWGSGDASRDELLTRIFLSMATLGMIPFVFAWKFIGEPPRAHSSIRGWVKELEEAIIEARDTDDAVYGIDERYKEGVRLLESGEDMKEWESGFDAYIKQHFDAGLFIQLCGTPPPTQGFTTIQRGDGPIKKIKHPPPGERERLEGKLHTISSLMPYAGTNYRGRTINSLDFKLSLIRQCGLPEHRLQKDIEA